MVLIERTIALSDDEPVVALEASLDDVRRLLERCEAEGIEANVARDACCGGGCSPKAQLVVSRRDAPRVAHLLQRDWLEALEREGTVDHEGLERLRSAHRSSASDEPPCPACGHVGPLVAGACADCGLQLG
jgi:hypothetical protein